eukprot:612281-Amphidinium_carterae.1
MPRDKDMLVRPCPLCGVCHKDVYVGAKTALVDFQGECSKLSSNGLRMEPVWLQRVLLHMENTNLCAVFGGTLIVDLGTNMPQIHNQDYTSESVCALALGWAMGPEVVLDSKRPHWTDVQKASACPWQTLCQLSSRMTVLQPKCQHEQHKPLFDDLVAYITATKWLFKVGDALPRVQPQGVSDNELKSSSSLTTSTMLHQSAIGHALGDSEL